VARRQWQWAGSSDSGKGYHKLLHHIKNARKPVLTQYDRYTDDKNTLSIQTHGIRGGGRIDELTLLEGVYEWQRFRQDGQTTVNANRGGLACPGG
jgi:hypothetical protein